MKKKDMVYLLLAVGIFLTAGYLGYVQLFPKTSNNNVVQVETVGPIPDKLDGSVLATLKDTSKVQNFNSPVDLNGLNNADIFGK